jgi:trans-2,3-dihydro-3-hydroxyanthranilate isomerase
VADYAYRIVNVFAEAPLEGNPLAVFEDGRGLDDATLQALALQFNLSETTFILPSTRGSARVRIFTPTFEMPFAGHPTLGTAHVVRALRRAGGGGVDGEGVTLEMKAGLIRVTADGDKWTLEANAPRVREVAAPREVLAAMVGVDIDALAADPMWVDTGSEQLVIPLTRAQAVRDCRPDAALLVRHGSVSLPGGAARAMAYVWAYDGRDAVVARFFFPKHGAIVEDPGTGSACANLGGWLVATNAALPRSLKISQGDAVGRPCRLGLAVDKEKRIFVSGRVIELGRGSISM